MLEDDPGQQRVPDGPDGVVVPALAPALLEQADDLFVCDAVVAEAQTYVVTSI